MTGKRELGVRLSETPACQRKKLNWFTGGLEEGGRGEWFPLKAKRRNLRLRGMTRSRTKGISSFQDTWIWG